jgi:kynurenine formamidase
MDKGMKSVVDCTHIIEEGMPVYPGTEGPMLLQACTLEEVGFREKKWTMYSHTGTHMDAPAHMVADGKTLDQFSVEKFMGRGMVLDVRECTAKEIPLVRVQSYESILGKVDYVLIQTGWEEYWGSEQYVGSFPALSGEAAEYLMKFNLKGIGVDAISIDLMDTESFPIHKILLENDLVIIENLKNLSLLEGLFDFYAFPLNVEDADGSPIRAIAVVEE